MARPVRPSRSNDGRPARGASRAGRLLVASFLVAAALGCTEDSAIFGNIGVAGVSITDTGMRPQSLSVGAPPGDDGDLSPVDPIQGVSWEVTRATLFLDGRELAVLEAGETCTIQASVDLLLPVAGPPCSEGVILESGRAFDVKLEVEFGMTVFRAAPIVLAPEEDEDGDGISNAEDNCPLVENEDQEDSEEPEDPDDPESPMGDGIGDVCDALPFDRIEGQTDRDSDADGVLDALDNCIAVANPAQEDEGFEETGLPDGIGNACDDIAQSAQVSLLMQTVISFCEDEDPNDGIPETCVAGPLSASGFVLDQGRLQFLSVIVDDPARACDWEAGTCALTGPDAISFVVPR